MNDISEIRKLSIFDHMNGPYRKIGYFLCVTSVLC